MVLIRLSQTWLSLLVIVRALTVQLRQDIELNLTDIPLLRSQPSSIRRPNQTSLSLDITVNKPAVFCDGGLYGRDLVLADCRDVITGIKRNSLLRRFGERSADQSTWDVGLPSRQIGSEDDAEELSCISILIS